VAIPATQEDNDVDDFVNPPSHMKKVISTKAFTKGGGRKKRVYEDVYFEYSWCEEG
jgi:hypothetical protein